MSINYDFGDLEAFLAVKETGSFHAAGEKLNLSQSAITRRIAKLETALDSLLFERTTRAVKPTLAAKRLQARAEAILEDARETSRAMRDESVAFAHQRNAIVTVACIPTVVAGFFLPALRRFRMEGFQSRIRLLDLSANDVAECVAEGEADFGICSIPTLEPGTSFEPLFEDSMMLVTHVDHPLAAHGAVTWADVAQEPLILPARGTGNRLLIDEAMAQAGHPLTWTYEVGRSTTATELVSAQRGVALLPRSASLAHGSNGLMFRPVTKPDINRPIGMLSRIEQQDTPAISVLKEALKGALPW